MGVERKKMKEWLFNKLHITRKPVVKVYNGYGDEDLLLVYGHVFRQSPLPKRKFKKNFWSNSMSLLRLFMAEPFRGVKLQMDWNGQLLETETDKDGFFKFEWQLPDEPSPGWHHIKVEMQNTRYAGTVGHGKVFVPYTTQYAFISDIDDTFLISHSANLRKRLYVLFTKNARTRKPFEGVVRHYQLLAHANTTQEHPNPFFYVSSSEWNLYDYILEFKRSYGLPEGVYLLSQMKRWYELTQTGQTKHSGKFMRIARVMKEFPHQKFILLGDDTQQDPEIYAKIVEGFKERIVCVYLRHVGKKKKPETEHYAREIRSHGVEVCYFNKSEEAIEHSKKIGLIDKI
jgi:phosphatidate phosphatase APP1